MPPIGSILGCSYFPWFHCGAPLPMYRNVGVAGVSFGVFFLLTRRLPMSVCCVLVCVVCMLIWFCILYCYYVIFCYLWLGRLFNCLVVLYVFYACLCRLFVWLTGCLFSCFFVSFGLFVCEEEIDCDQRGQLCSKGCCMTAFVSPSRIRWSCVFVYLDKFSLWCIWYHAATNTGCACFCSTLLLLYFTLKSGFVRTCKVYQNCLCALLKYPSTSSS